MKMWKSAFCVLTAFLVVATACGAQEQGKARIFGAVTDKQGAAIPDAKIKVIPKCKCSDCANPERCDCCPNQVTVTTGADGHFEVHVSPGSYTLETLGKQLEVTVGPNEDRSANIIVE